MSDISGWSNTAASNNSSAPNGWPEGMAPSGVNDSGREVMAAVRRWYEDAQWINFGHTPTRVDNDTFTVATDLTAIYEAGRRLRVGGSATGYCTIASSSYSAPDTTVNVTMDSGNLPGTLSTVSVGIMSYTSSSLPLIPDGRLSSNVPLKNAANSFTATQSITTTGSNFGLAITTDNSATDALSLVDSSSTYHNWSVGPGTGGAGFGIYDVTATRLPFAIGTGGNVTINAPSSSDALTVAGGSSNGYTIVATSAAGFGAYLKLAQSGQNAAYLYNAASSDELRLNAAGADRIKISTGVQFGAPAGGDKGAGTLNTAGTIYQNNVPVATESASTFTGTLGDCSAGGSGTVKYARDGKHVTLWVESDLTGTAGFTTTLTMSGVPAEIQSSVTTYSDIFFRTYGPTGASHDQAAIATISGGTITFYVVSALSGATPYSPTGWPAISDTKGLRSGWKMTYVLP